MNASDSTDRALVATVEGRNQAVIRCAAELYKQGAVRVRLFGSLLRGTELDAKSDIDLSVEGLGAARLRELQQEFREKEELKIDLVRLEDSLPSFRRVVLASSRLIPNG